uniref:zinc finger protein ZFP2-like n=1 Tax=Semicossyphus pulcher TaxID=241346 RepID=UPI0037E78BA9
MSKVQMLRACVNQRLTAAAEEIFELLERTIAEYEEELCRSKENQRKIVDAVFNPEVRLNRADFQQLLVNEKKVPPEQQEWSSILDQDGSQEPQHIKEEQEELWTNQEGEQLQGLKQADVSTLILTPVPVKTEEAEGEDCGGSEPARDFNPDSRLHLLFSQCVTDDISRYLEETKKPETSVNPVQNKEKPVSYMVYNNDNVSISSSDCATSLGHKEHKQKHNGIQTGVKPFSCPVCGKKYPGEGSLSNHIKLHSVGKHFSCSVCRKTFPSRAEVVTHMRTHTGEKPFGCSLCGREFAQKGHLRQHLAVHRGEKPFSCSICGKRFTLRGNLRQHLIVHTGEKPFSCSVCNKSYSRLQYFKIHKCENERSRIK